MATVTNEIREEIRELVYDFLSEECERDRNNLTDNTNVVDDLEGDSLMLIEMLELIKKKYQLSVEIQTVGKYILRHPAKNIGQTIDLLLLIIEHENKIAELV
jgi:acyl carrier protein